MGDFTIKQAVRLVALLVLWGCSPVAGQCESGSCGADLGTSLAGPPVSYGAGDVFWEDGCEAGCGCSAGGDICFEGVASPQLSRWCAGVELTLLKPAFESNSAFSILQGDGATAENFSAREFEYDVQLAPRAWLEVMTSQSTGMRFVYWGYDHEAGAAIGSPAANGFGRITPPSFANIDLSTTVPDSQYTANSDINAYTMDLEATKSHRAADGGWLVGFGLRYADIEQTYSGRLLNDLGDVQGTIDFAHQVRGIGPTLSGRVQRAFIPGLEVFGFARGSLIFGDGESTLNAVEDADLDPSLTTSQVLNRDDLLPIGEMQLGFQWCPGSYGAVLPYFHAALEAQVWHGAGSASSEDGNMGFFGFNIALGFNL